MRRFGAPGRTGPAALALLACVLIAGCEPPLTAAAESLALRTVFRDLTGDGVSACLRTAFLDPPDSSFSPVLETALRQREVPLYRSALPPDTSVRLVAVSPVREIDDALALDAAVLRTVVTDQSARGARTEWTYELRCGPAECTVRSRLGPRTSERALAGDRARTIRAGRGGRCPR